MIRTYRSKKETGGGLDRKDLLQNLDEKSSAYDAFYIQNIKQTKRELSCIGSSKPYSVASKKVRKRKYVRRIIKESETRPRESLSKSAYLTPDKSLRVNKPLDPFDMLFDSSPACPVDAAGDKSRIVSRKVDLFDEIFVAKKESKTYRRKKPVKVKKFNYSSETDTDKENSDEQLNISKNISDIKTHELLVEQEAKHSPKRFDDSINKVVKNISLLNRLHLKNSFNESLKMPFGHNRNRLTNNIKSPILQKSPLCSTPFKAKYRGESIYKFSPISVTTNERSPKCIPIAEDDVNSSLILLSKDVCPRKMEENSQIPINNATTNNSVIEFKEGNFESNKVQRLDDVKYEMNKKEFQDSKIMVSEEISSSQTTEIEPFIGFSNSEIRKLNNVKNYLEVEVTNTIPETDIIEVNGSYSERNNIIVNEELPVPYSVTKKDYESIIEENNETINEESALPDDTDKSFEDYENSISSSSSSIVSEIFFDNYSSLESSEMESLYDTCSSDRSSINNKFAERKPVIQIERMNDSDFLRYYEKMPVYGSDEENDSVSNDNLTENSEDFASLNNSNSCAMSEPVIKIERMNDSDFLRYYEKMPAYGSDEENDSVSNDSSTEDREEFASLNNSNSSDKDKSLENNILDNEADVYSRSDSISSNYDDLESSNDSDSGEKYVSFVTTRRKNEVTNNSIMSIFDHSYGSASTECDKTVLSNIYVEENISAYNDTLETKDKLNKLDTNESNDEITCKDAIPIKYQNTEFVEKYTRTKKSSIVARKSSIKHRKSIGIRKTASSHPDNKSPKETTMSGFDEKDKLFKLGTRQSLEATNNKLLENTSALDKIPKSDKNTEFAEEDTRMSFITTRKSSIAGRKSSIKPRKTNLRDSSSPIPKVTRNSTFDIKQGIVLQPGKKWERSLSIYRRMTMTTDHFDQSILEDEALEMKGRKYRQSVISTMEKQDLHGSHHNESINSRRSTFISKPSRSTIRIVKDPSSSRLSLCNTTVFDDLQGFLNEECDDTIVDLSKLSIADQTHEVTVIDNFHDTSGRLATARDYVLRRCNQTDAILFDECYPDTVLKNCHKIGEGVYGEVFLWRARDGRARVLKIVPIAGSIKVNGECQKDYHEIISEIVIAMELSGLRAPIAEIQRHFDEGKEIEALDLHTIENCSDVFNEVLAVRCVYGSYPSRLLDLWDLYDECKGSENDNPAILPVDQHYIVLELANAGQDLESYQFNNAEQAHALFLQVAYGLAVGEEAFQFEHRDLHWGNVLIAPTDEKLATFVLRGRSHRVARCGVAATIIDYSLSRVSLPLAGECAALYNDLAADDALFDAVGDYQFEVYRLMREKLGNDWKNFEPYTNILWLHYTVDKMITALRYKRTSTKIHKHYIDKLKGIKDRILGYGSAALFVLTDQEK